MFQLVLWNLLLPDSQGERSPALQGMAECEETLQVVVLVRETDDGLECDTRRCSRNIKL